MLRLAMRHSGFETGQTCVMTCWGAGSLLPVTEGCQQAGHMSLNVVMALSPGCRVTMPEPVRVLLA